MSGNMERIGNILNMADFIVDRINLAWIRVDASDKEKPASAKTTASGSPM